MIKKSNLKDATVLIAAALNDACWELEQVRGLRVDMGEEIEITGEVVYTEAGLMLRNVATTTGSASTETRVEGQVSITETTNNPTITDTTLTPQIISTSVDGGGTSVTTQSNGTRTTEQFTRGEDRNEEENEFAE